MRITLKTFEHVTFVLFFIGLFLSVSSIHEIRIVGYLMAIMAAFLLYQIDQEVQKRKKKIAFIRRMERIIASSMAA